MATDHPFRIKKIGKEIGAWCNNRSQQSAQFSIGTMREGSQMMLEINYCCRLFSDRCALFFANDRLRTEISYKSKMGPMHALLRKAIVNSSE